MGKEQSSRKGALESSWGRQRAYRVGLLAGLADQLFDLRDVSPQVVLKLFDGFDFLQQAICFLLQAPDAGICSSNFTRQKKAEV